MGGVNLSIRLKYCTLLVVFMWLGAFSASAQFDFSSDYNLSCEANSSEVDISLSENESQLGGLTSYLRKLIDDPTITLKRITITASASPEGSYEYNTKLATQRLQAIYDAVAGIEGVADSMIVVVNKGIAWEDLKSLISASDEEYRDEVLRILDKEERLMPYYDDLTIDRRVYDLMAINGGRVWRHMKETYFPQLRVMRVTNISYRQYYDFGGVDEISRSAAPHIAPVSEIVTPVHMQEFVRPELWQQKLRAKSNAIGWSMFVGNGAVELDLDSRWSVSLPVYYSALDYFSRRTKFKTLTVQPELRYWLGRGRNWYAGVHAGVGWYNFALNGEYRIQDCGWAHPALGGGVGGGYRMDIFRNGRWQLEFSLGAGVYAVRYDKFFNEPNGLIAETVRRTWFGIDQAAVSFIYSFGLNRYRWDR